MAGLPQLVLFPFSPFHRSFEPERFGTGLDDVGAVGDSIQQRFTQSRIGKHGCPFRERQVGCDDQSRPFRPIRDHLEQELGTNVGKRHVPKSTRDLRREQIAAWQLVTSAVHSRGGRIIIQLQHSGRNSYSWFMPDGGPPFAPSAIPSSLPGFTADFQQVPIETPRVLLKEQIRKVIADFRNASIHAMDAAFDGVEIQAAVSAVQEQHHFCR